MIFKRIVLNVHGIQISLECNDEEFIHELERDLSFFVKTDQEHQGVAKETQEAQRCAHHVTARLTIADRIPAARPKHNLSMQLGSTLRLNDKRLEWRLSDWFRYQVALEDANRITIDAVLVKPPKPTGRKPRPWRLAALLRKARYGAHRVSRTKRQQEKRFGRYQYAWRFLVHFPAFWLLGKLKGWEVDHGAAISKGDQALVLAGYDGSGKSTLAYYLCQHKGYAFLSDNFVLHDSKYVYVFPERIRLTDRSRAQLEIDREPSSSAFGKGRYDVEIGSVQAKVPIRLILLNTFGTRTQLLQQRLELCRQAIKSMRFFVPEFQEYNLFRSMISLIDLSTPVTEEPQALERLLTNQNTFILMKAWDSSVEEVATVVEQCL